MATSYPAALDNFTNPTSGDPLNSPPHASQHTDVNDAVEAIQAELGLNPSGSYSTVLARIGGMALDVKAYGAVGDGVTDDTAAIQAAIDDAASTEIGAVYFPGSTGTYLVTQLEWKRAVNLYGPQMGRAEIEQAAGVNASMIVSDTSLPGTEFFHWTVMEGLRLQGNEGGNTAGSGIEINMRTGEGFCIRNVQIHDFPDHGLHFKRGGQPLILEDLHLFSNAKYGVRFDRTGGDIWQTVTCHLISGDGNASGLIGIGTASAAEESFHFNGIKAESGAGALNQPYVVVCDSTGSAQVFIRNVSAKSIGATQDALVHITGNASPRIWMEGFRRDAGVTNVIADDVNGIDYADWTDLGVVYNGSANNPGVQYRFRRQGILQNGEETSVYNVRFYGAVGDGSTDDTAEIQAAIDACEANGGGTVFFPSGTYIVTKVSGQNYCLVVDSPGVKMMGAGMYNTTIKVGDSQTTRVASHLLIDAADDFELCHLTWDGNRTGRGFSAWPGGDDDAVDFKNGNSRAWIHDFRCMNSPADAIDVDGGITDLWVERYYAVDNGGNSLHMSNPTRAVVSDSVFTGNSIWRGNIPDTDAAAIDVRDTGDTVVISGCYFKGNFSNIAAEASELLVNDCYIEGGAVHIDMLASGRMAITGNYLRLATTAAIRTVGTTANTTISGNTFEGNTAVWSKAASEVLTWGVNAGYVLDKHGSDTIADTTSSKVVAHGLATTPDAVTVTPQGDDRIWVTSVGATNFTANRAGTSGALGFYWRATGVP